MDMDRRLLVGAVSLVRGRVRGDIQAGSEARDKVEALLGDAYFADGPFRRVGVIIRYGERTNLEPECQRIRKVDGELPIAFELDMAVLRKLRGDELREFFRQALIEVLIGVARKYDRPCESLIAAWRPEVIPRENIDTDDAFRMEDEVRTLTKQTGQFYRSQIIKTFPNPEAAKAHRRDLVQEYTRQHGSPPPGNRMEQGEPHDDQRP